MGYFSFTKADVHNTKVANIRFNDSFKCLIPREFGGGFILGVNYNGYGDITDETGNTYDLNELVAMWNGDAPYNDGKVRDYLLGVPEGCYLKTQDEFTDNNRSIGIAIGCYFDEINKLKYPLKIVSLSYKGDYESLLSMSYSDPNQGGYSLTWKAYDEYIARQQSRGE